MLDRLIKLEEAVTVTIGLLHNPIELLQESEWTALREFHKILEPFEQISTEISAEKNVTISKVINISSGLIYVLNRFNSEIQTSVGRQLLVDLLDCTSKRFDKIEYNLVLAKASIMDPRFKTKAFSSPDSLKNVKDALQGEIVTNINKAQQNVESNARHVDEECPQDEQVALEDENKKPSLIWQNFDDLHGYHVRSAISDYGSGHK
nr:unnamed protein product [Callosobruchus chinensis]